MFQKKAAEAFSVLRRSECKEFSVCRNFGKVVACSNSGFEGCEVGALAVGYKVLENFLTGGEVGVAGFQIGWSWLS